MEYAGKYNNNTHKKEAAECKRLLSLFAMTVEHACRSLLYVILISRFFSSSSSSPPLSLGEYVGGKKKSKRDRSFKCRVNRRRYGSLGEFACREILGERVKYDREERLLLLFFSRARENIDGASVTVTALSGRGTRKWHAKVIKRERESRVGTSLKFIDDDCQVHW